VNSPIEDRFLTDWSGLRRGAPSELHRPADTSEVAAIVRRCHASHRSITVQGGLTGLAGGAVPADGDVVINLERMNRIEDIDDLEGVMRVQAGATLEQVQSAAAAAGWYFPVDLGARGSCQVGGNAATNAGGQRVLRYGTMRDSVLGVEVVLADGKVLDSLTCLVKNSAGLDPRFLFIGSEGTLGIITRLVLKLQPPPGPPSAAIAALPDVASLARLLRHLKQTLGGMLHAYEFMSRRFVELSVSLTSVGSPVDPSAPWAVLVEARGVQGQTVEESLQAALAFALEDGLISDCAIAASLSDVEAFWRLRQSTPELLTHLKPTVNFDCGLPLRHIPGFVDRVDARLRERFPAAQHLFFGHLGDNNIHLVTGPHREEDMHSVDELVYRELEGHQGTISAEHGIGFIKKPFLAHTRCAAQIELLRSLKRALDPRQVLNPGRVLD
jgi:FAD/FMN-containing dehydrogenase